MSTTNVKFCSTWRPQMCGRAFRSLDATPQTRCKWSSRARLYLSLIGLAKAQSKYLGQTCTKGHTLAILCSFEGGNIMLKDDEVLRRCVIAFDAAWQNVWNMSMSSWEHNRAQLLPAICSCRYSNVEACCKSYETINFASRRYFSVVTTWTNDAALHYRTNRCWTQGVASVHLFNNATWSSLHKVLHQLDTLTITTQQAWCENDFKRVHVSMSGDHRLFPSQRL